MNTTVQTTNDVDVLRMSLACDAFEMIDADHFEVNANLSADDPESLKRFKQFQDVLMMAYQRGTSASPFISIADNLPPPETDVLCLRADGLPPIVAGLFHGEMKSEETGEPPRGRITHWGLIALANVDTQISTAAL